MNRPHIPFVFGHPRSGTSLLTAILDRHSKIAMAPETHLLSALKHETGGQGHEHVLVVAWDVLRTRMGDLHFQPDLILERFRQHPATPEGLLHAVLELWAERAGKPVAGEKTPAHLPFAGRILEAIPEARAIILVRDGRAVVAAMRRTELHSDSPIDQLVDGWISAARSSARWLEEYPERAWLVRFEALVTRPEATLQPLLEWLGVEYEPAMLRPGPTATFRRWEDYAKRDVRRAVIREKAEGWREGQALLTADHVERLAPWLTRFAHRTRALAPMPDSKPPRARSAASATHPATENCGDARPILLVGAHRAGCASFATWLWSHPGVAKPPAVLRPHLALDWPLTRAEFLGRIGGRTEAGAGALRAACHPASYYLAHPDLPRRALHIIPDARIVVLLRHPVLRTYSHWLRQWRLGTEQLPFCDAVAAEAARLGDAEVELLANEPAIRFNHIHYSYVLQSRYSNHLERWYRAFPADQIMVLVLEELLRDVGSAWQRICRHAGLPETETPDFPRIESLAWPLSQAAVIASSTGQLVRSDLADDLARLGRMVNLGDSWEF